MTDADSAGPDSTGVDLSTRLSTGLTRFVDRWRPLGNRLERAVGHSSVGQLAARVRGAAARSRIVRWLTREPDPAVVVIDLAETRTVGPVLRVLDAIAVTVGNALRETGVTGRVANAARTIERNAVPTVSAAVFGMVVGTLALTWQGAEPLWLLALSIAGVAGLLGLTVDRSPAAVADSTVGRWLVALLAPPGEDGEPARTR